MLRHYGVSSFVDLLNKGLLYPEEYKELIAAQAVLFRMRFALHLQLKRYDNRLRFDRQLQLSEILGYQGEANQAVELMMRDYFQATKSISQLSQLLLNSFEQAYVNELQKMHKNNRLISIFIGKNSNYLWSNVKYLKPNPQQCWISFSSYKRSYVDSECRHLTSVETVFTATTRAYVLFA